MSDLPVSRDAAVVADHAAERFAQLEALLDAVRMCLIERSLECLLVDIGLDAAGRHSNEMRNIARGRETPA